METRLWWFKIETCHGTVTVLFIQHGSLHIMIGAVINCRIQG